MVASGHLNNNGRHIRRTKSNIRLSDAKRNVGHRNRQNDIHNIVRRNPLASSKIINVHAYTVLLMNMTAGARSAKESDPRIWLKAMLAGIPDVVTE